MLANPTNRALLSVLASEPQYPRRIADLVGLTEHEASRRLRAFEKLGLAEGTWSNIGRTVRLYRLSTTKFEVTLGQQGLEVTGLSSKAPRVAAGPVAEMPPALQGFVGRAEELAELRRLLEERTAVVVQGIGGAGKTSLAAALAAQGRRPVIWHTVTPGESAAILISRLAASTRPLETPERAARFTLFHAAEEAAALTQAIAETANRVGALVVLDRFEHADTSAGEVAADLARQLTQACMIITTRSWPRELPRDRVGTFALGGMSSADAAQLLSALAVPPARAAALLERTRGHPLALRLLAQAKASAPGTAAPFEESSLRDFLLNDVLPQLSDSEREVLLALSVLRTPFLAEEAEAVAANRGALVALAKLEARGLLLRSGDMHAVHDLIRAFAVTAVPDRKQVHARAAKVLLASGEATKALEALHHMAEAGQVEKALQVVLDEATKGTYRFADLGLLAPYRDVLLRLTAAPAARGEGRAAAEIELGTLGTLTGDGEAAGGRFEAARTLLVPRETLLRGAWTLGYGRWLAAEGRSEEALRMLAQARGMAERLGDDRITLEALIALAYMHEGQGHDPEATAAYHGASEIARRAGDLRALSVALSGESRILSMSGDPRAGPMAADALHMARLGGYPRGEAAAYMTLVNIAVLTGQRDIPPEYNFRYLQIAEMLGDPFTLACALTDTAYFLALDGRFDEALRLAGRGIEVAQTIRSAIFEGSGVFAITKAHLGLGRAKQAANAIGTFLQRDGKLLDQWPYMAWRAYELQAEALAACGDGAGAAAARHSAEQFKARGGVIVGARPAPAAGETSGRATQPTRKVGRSKERTKPPIKRSARRRA